MSKPKPGELRCWVDDDSGTGRPILLIERYRGLATWRWRFVNHRGEIHSYSENGIESDTRVVE